MKHWSVRFDVSAEYEFFVKGQTADSAREKLRKLLEKGELEIRIYPEGAQQDHFLIDSDVCSCPSVVIETTEHEPEADWCQW
jgi:hypothetical protein